MQTGARQRKLGHYEINWKIENFIFACREQKETFETPEFSLTGRTLTKWRLGLDRSYCGGEFYTTLNVQRVKTEDGPVFVWSRWKIWVKCGVNNEEYRVEEFGRIFGKGHDYNCKKMALGKLFGGYSPFESDVFTIRCLLLFNDTYSEQISPGESVPIGLLSLSKDISSLLKPDNIHDVLLKNNTAEVKAHKGVLSCRSDVLTRMIVNDCVNDTIDLKDIGVDDLYPADLYSFVEYLYSGDFDAFIREPTFAKQEIVRHLNVQEINDWFILDKLFIESKYVSYEFTKDWIIGKFSRKCKTIESPVWRSSMPFKFKLRFYPRPSMVPNYLSVLLAEMVNEDIPSNTCMQISVMKEKDTVISKQTYRPRGLPYRHFGFPEFATEEQIMSSLVNNTLHIRLKLKSCPSNTTWNTTFQYRNSKGFPRKRVAGLGFYTKLSLDMLRMFTEDIFSDVIVKAGDTYCKSHNYILSARSKTFARKSLYGNFNFIILEDLDPNVYRTFFFYIYSGVLRCSEVDVLLAVYKIAVKFAVECLLTICSNLLRENMTTQTVSSIYEVAEFNNDEPLKLSVLEFVTQNVDTVFDDPGWKNLLEKLNVT